MTAPQKSFPESGNRANRWLLYGPLAAGAVIFIIYSIVWFVGAGIMRGEVDNWIADQRASGLTVEHGKISIQGYPFLLRAKLETPSYGDQAEGWEWQGETLYVDTLPYNPTKLILTPHGDQKMLIGKGDRVETWRVASSMLRASIAERTNALELHDIEAIPEGGFSTTGYERIVIGSLKVNTLIKDDEDTGLKDGIGQFALQGQAILLDHQDKRKDIKVSFTDASLQATYLSGLLAAISGGSYAEWRQGDGQIDINSIRLVINGADDEIPPSQIAITGTLFVDGANYPAGLVETSIANQTGLLSILVHYGLLDADDARNVDSTLSMLSQAMGDDMRVPVELKKGRAQIKTPLGGVTIARLSPLN